MIRKIAIFCLLSPSLAFADPDDGCRHFFIQISNSTEQECFLISTEIAHGFLVSPPPLSILPHHSKQFEMEQTYYGPSIALGYKCGDESIYFSSQQNYCMFEAGNIVASLQPPLPAHLTAKFIALPGSYYESLSGSIDWSISDVDSGYAHQF